VQVITFLRDPVARVVSQYRYFLELSRDPAMPHNQFKSLLRGRTLDQLLLDRKDPFVEQYFCEMQTFSLHSHPFMHYRNAVKHLPRCEVLEQAKRHLERVDVLGLVERMEQSVQRMCSFFGWDQAPLHHEMRSRTDTAVERSSSLEELI